MIPSYGSIISTSNCTIDSGLKKSDSGDLYVHVNVSRHEKFERNGSDIYSEEQINVSQAVLGDKIHVDTLDGKIALKIPSGIQSGKKLRLSGKGM